MNTASEVGIDSCVMRVIVEKDITPDEILRALCSSEPKPAHAQMLDSLSREIGVTIETLRRYFSPWIVHVRPEL
jgi:hypothetical protein